MLILLNELDVWCAWQGLVLAVLRFVVIIAVKKNEMGGACSAYGEEERRIQGFGG